MKYYVIPAKNVQSGDVIFTNNGDGKGIQFCGRVIGQTLPSSHPMIMEWRVEIINAVDPSEEGTHTTIGFRHDTMVGVAREDQYVDTDVAAILADLENE